MAGIILLTTQWDAQICNAGHGNEATCQLEQDHFRDQRAVIKKASATAVIATQLSLMWRWQKTDGHGRYQVRIKGSEKWPLKIGLESDIVDGKD